MVTKVASKVGEQDLGPWIIGGAAFLLLAKYAVDQVPNPFPAIKRGAITTINTADELTGGIQGDPTSSTYWFSLDIPFVERDIPLAPGLIKDPDESWPQYIFGFDVPGRAPINPASSIYDAAKGLYRKVF
jgi:hypothetical protein